MRIFPWILIYCHVAAGFSLLGDTQSFLNFRIAADVNNHSTITQTSWLYEQRQVANENRFSNQDNFPQCCYKPYDQPNVKVASVYYQCVQETTPNDPLNNASDDPGKRSVKRFVCIADCMGKKLQVADVEGNILEDNLSKFITSSSQWRTLFIQRNDILSRCTNFTNRTSEEYGNVYFYGQRCNLASAVVSQCIRSMMEVNCPEGMKVRGTQCNVHRQRIIELLEILKV
ncbi:uncharacterized protein [Periplaneta americana]|uniref:uncharacterized protein n=1 Tax=Periplaneta americana TaxID=6978 RepID=UPI0037E7E53F